jgi:excisionase family DNA binding protein
MQSTGWLTVAEIAEQLKVSDQAVRRWIRSGALPAQNFGGRAGYRVKANDLNAFLEQGPSAAKRAA